MRTLHRWVSTFAIVFLLWVTLTGTLLAIDTMWPPDFGASGPDASWINHVPTRLKIHNLLQDLHRGSIIGLPGQIIDFFTGLCFVFLSVSGTIMYVQMLKRRRKTGKKSLFWGKRFEIRAVHRWLASALAVFLLYLSATGSAISVVQISDPSTIAPIRIVNGVPVSPNSKPPAAAEAEPGQPKPAVPKPEGEKSLSTFLQDLHSGKTFGRVGEWIMLVTGMSLLTLSITGLWMYLKILRVRRKRGLSEIFWS